MYPTAQLIVDGTLLECWSWKDHPELYSGKHKDDRAGCPGRMQSVRDTDMSVQPHDRRVYDAEALRRCGLLDVPPADLPDGASPPRHIGEEVHRAWA